MALTTAAIAIFACLIALTPVPAAADPGDCSQPQTSGPSPTATDCLAILRVAVGSRSCQPHPPCVCAPKGTLPTTATDALVCLKIAVGSGVEPKCPCENTTTTTVPVTTTVADTTTTTLAPTTSTTMPVVTSSTTTLPAPTTTQTTTTLVIVTTTLPPADADGDGWRPEDGDCCDRLSDGCATPALTNPGAYDFEGDGFDEDCNGTADDGALVCDQALASNSNVAGDHAKALGLCVTTTADAALPERRSGLLSASFLRPDGTSSPAANSRAIRPQFGGVMPQQGVAELVLSTGHAAAPGQTNPGFAAFQPGKDMETSSDFPQDWLALNEGNLPHAPGCPEAVGNAANDGIMLELQIRVPTNARSLTLAANFLTAEFPEWICTEFFDLFVALLDSSATGNPPDKNLAMYETGSGEQIPVGAGLAYGDTTAFRQCRNGVIGCKRAATTSMITTCTGTGELFTSGFDAMGEGCEAGDVVGGGTGWLTLRGNVVPGETIKLRLAIWDTSDHTLDSVVVLDDLRWGTEPVDAGAVP